MTKQIEMVVNGVAHHLSVEPRETLLEVLRHRLQLTGAKLGCDQQVCGTCTVLMDDLPVSACSVLAVDADAKRILTIEGLAPEGELHRIQRQFIEAGAFQCAYCTPGMVMAIKALQEQLPHASEEEIRHFLSGNICRCGCHMEIFEVVRSICGG